MTKQRMTRCAIDLLIAEQVVGFTLLDVPADGSGLPRGYDGVVFTRGEDPHFAVFTGTSEDDGAWSPTRDIAAAITIVPKVVTASIGFEATVGDNGRWLVAFQDFARLHDPTARWGAVNESLPMAISLAALGARGIDVELAE